MEKTKMIFVEASTHNLAKKQSKALGMTLKGYIRMLVESKDYTAKDLEGKPFEEQVKIMEGVSKWVYIQN